MNASPQLTIVIPALNEVESIPVLLKEIQTVCEAEKISYEVIVIDDGSKDGTFACVDGLAKVDGRIKGVQFRHNCGKAAALSEGFARAQGEFVITMDADLQDNPTEIPGILKLIHEGADLVSGWKKKRYDPIHKTWPSKLFNIVTSRVAGVRLHDFNCGLKGYRSEVVKSLDLYGELHRYIPVMANWNGFKVVEKIVEHRARKFGHSKYGWARLTNGPFDLMTLVFLHRYTSRPLHLFGFVGFIFSMLGSLILAGFGINWIVTGNGHVRPLMLAGVASVILGIQFVSIGLLGEMINHRMSARSNPVRREVGFGEAQ